MFAEFGSGQVLWSMVWFFLFILWIMLLFSVWMDIFRSRDLNGLYKTLWLIFTIVTPYLGVFVYLIARGGKMAEHRARDVADQEAAFRQQVQQAAGGSSGVATELERLASLKQQGIIDDTEFQKLKAKVIG